MRSERRRRPNRVAGLLALALTVVPGAGWAGGADSFARLEGHGGPVRDVAISPDGRLGLTGSFDTSAGLWDLRSGELVRWLEGHDASVNAVAFLPDGRRALTGSSDDTIILWDLEKGTILHRFEGHNAKVIGLDVSPDGHLVASASWDNRIGLWDIAGEAPVRWLTGHTGIVNDVRFAGSGARLYSASQDGTVRRWDVATGRLDATLIEHGFGVNQVMVDADETWLAYGAVDGAIRVLDLATGRQIADLSGDRRPILAMALSDDGKLLAVGDGQGYISIINTSRWTIERDFRAALRGPVWALAWEPGGKRLMTGGLAEEAVLWPVRASLEGALLKALPASYRTGGEMSNGERQFVRRCSICHSLDPDDRRRAGPTLWGVFGRRAGTAPGYRYSEGLKHSPIVWNEETISKLFELGPQVVTPGSKMPLQQIPDPADRRDLIAFLKEATGARSANTGDAQ